MSLLKEVDNNSGGDNNNNGNPDSTKKSNVNVAPSSKQHKVHRQQHPVASLSGSLKPIGARPLGFDIVAKIRRLEKKEQSKRRLIDHRNRMLLEKKSERNFSMPDIGPPPPMMTSPTKGRRAYGSYNTGDGDLVTIEELNASKKMLMSEYAPLKATTTSETIEVGSDGYTSSRYDEVEEEGKEEMCLQLTTYDLLMEMIFYKYVSVLLVFLPFAFISHFMKWEDTLIFWFNFLALVPLASVLGDFTEEVAAHTNQTIGGLVNATFGNAVEVVVGIQALLANEIRVVQASMIGSIFSNLLLVLGSCFLFGGLRYKEQSFNSTAATANMSLLALSSIALVLPTPFANYYEIQDEHVLVISRFAAIFLMLMYMQLLIFQLHTHSELFDDYETTSTNNSCRSTSSNNDDTDEKLNNGDSDNKKINDNIIENDDDDDDGPKVSMPVALVGLFSVTILIAILSDYLVESIDGFVQSSGISRTFVGLIILPIVGNVVEHLTAVTVAMKDKMDLSMGIAVGSCTQISLFVVPLMVMVGWIADKNMTLNFPHFEIILYVLSVFTVSVCLSNPKGNWLEGSLLITTYVMIAVGFWYENVVDF